MAAAAISSGRLFRRGRLLGDHATCLCRRRVEQLCTETPVSQSELWVSTGERHTLPSTQPTVTSTEGGAGLHRRSDEDAASVGGDSIPV